MDYVIDAWDESHARWRELVALIREEGQARWALDDERLKPNSHALVAAEGPIVVGFLTFAVQPLSRDANAPVVHARGEPLTEAYVQTFAVRKGCRARGVGAALQREALRFAGRLGCYQMRSWSDMTRVENYAVKVKLGFCAHPAIYHSERTGEDYDGVYWIKRVGLEGR